MFDNVCDNSRWNGRWSRARNRFICDGSQNWRGRVPSTQVAKLTEEVARLSENSSNSAKSLPTPNEPAYRSLGEGRLTEVRSPLSKVSSSKSWQR